MEAKKQELIEKLTHVADHVDSTFGIYNKVKLVSNGASFTACILSVTAVSLALAAPTAGASVIIISAVGIGFGTLAPGTKAVSGYKQYTLIKKGVEPFECNKSTHQFSNSNNRENQSFNNSRSLDRSMNSTRFGNNSVRFVESREESFNSQNETGRNLRENYRDSGRNNEKFAYYDRSGRNNHSLNYRDVRSNSRNSYHRYNYNSTENFRNRPHSSHKS